MGRGKKRVAGQAFRLEQVDAAVCYQRASPPLLNDTKVMRFLKEHDN